MLQVQAYQEALMAASKLAVWACLDSPVCHDGSGLMEGVAVGRWRTSFEPVCAAAGAQLCLDTIVLQEASPHIWPDTHHSCAVASNALYALQLEFNANLVQ